MYLTRDRNGTYYTRIPLPKTLRDEGYPNCLRFSLHTKDRRVASQRNLATAYVLKREVDNHLFNTGPDGLIEKASSRIQALRMENAWCLPVMSGHPSGEKPPRTRRSNKGRNGAGFEAKLRIFIKTKTIHGVSLRTLRQLETRIGSFGELVGPTTSLNKVKTKHALAFRDQLTERGLGPKTIKDYLSSCRQFFEWARLCEDVRQNPFEGVQPNARSRQPANQARDTWSAEDLELLFKLDRFRQPARLNQNDFWVTCVLLYSGMRPSEACQLRLEDVAEIEGRLCFRVRDDGDRQRLKNEHSRRIIPVHAELIRLGIRQWADFRRAENKVQLFEASPSQAYGEWSAAYLRRVSKHLRANRERFIGKPEIYGLRHTFVDRLKQQGIPEPVVAALVGHSENSITFGRYGKRCPVEALFDAVDQLDFGLTIDPVDF